PCCALPCASAGASACTAAQLPISLQPLSSNTAATTAPLPLAASGSNSAISTGSAATPCSAAALGRIKSRSCCCPAMAAAEAVASCGCHCCSACKKDCTCQHSMPLFQYQQGWGPVAFSCK